MALEPKFIRNEDISKLLNPRVLLDRLEDALGKMSLGKDGGVEQPMRSAVSVEKHRGALLVMPGYSSSDDALATKLISFYPENVERPSHQAWIMLFEPTNGDLCAIIDGVNITSIRTGIVSAIATKHLANPNSRILAIIGTGIQAYGHFEALSLVQHFDEVRVWGRTYEKAHKLVQELSARPDIAGTTVRACTTAKEAVTDADVICTVTFATTPVVFHEWVKPGAHINAIGACRPEWQELDSTLMRSSVVYTDSRDACLKESGDIILSECEVYADIGEVITGQKEALWQQTTVFKSVGVAIEDVISAKIVYDEYVKQNATASSHLASFLSGDDSDYCMQEFDVAYHHNIITKRKKRLVVLMALDSPSDLYADDASDKAALRHYLRRYTYIDYTAGDWLDKLLYALPLHGMDQAVEHQDDSVNQQDTVDLLPLH